MSQKLTDNIIDDIITSVSAFSGNEMKSCLGFLHGKRFSLDRQELVSSTCDYSVLWVEG